VSVDLWWYDVHVALTDTDLAELSDAEWARAAAFRFADDRRRYEVAHVMLRKVLAEYAGLPPRALVFGQYPCPSCGKPRGRPMLIGGGPQFSLTHAGDWIAVAVAEDPVGVDVEGPPRGCPCPLADQMHPDDRAVVTSLPEPARHAATMRWWVRAEAVFKCRGEGIAHGVDLFPVLDAVAASEATRADRVRTVGGCAVMSVPAPTGYQAAVAVSGDDVSVALRHGF
jgi:4'-phosphopantetheinyl transferase